MYNAYKFSKVVSMFNYIQAQIIFTRCFHVYLKQQLAVYWINSYPIRYICPTHSLIYKSECVLSLDFFIWVIKMISIAFVLVLFLHCFVKTEVLKDHTLSNGPTADKRMVYWKRFYNPNNEMMYPGEENFMFTRPRFRYTHHRYPSFAEGPYNNDEQAKK